MVVFVRTCGISLESPHLGFHVAVFQNQESRSRLSELGLARRVGLGSERSSEVDVPWERLEPMISGCLQ